MVADVDDDVGDAPDTAGVRTWNYQRKIDCFIPDTGHSGRRTRPPVMTLSGHLAKLNEVARRGTGTESRLWMYIITARRITSGKRLN